MKRRRDIRPLQAQVLRWAEKRDHIALFLEMRLGKTLAAIRWGLLKSGPRIVVAPLTLLPVWRSELSRTGCSAVLLRGDWEKKLARVQPSTWVLVNYEALRSDAAAFLRLVNWRTAILDESVTIKNPQALVTKACHKLLGDVPRRAVLSGLPTPESWLEIFEPMRFILGSFADCSNYWQFRFRYFRLSGYQWFPRRGSVDKIKAYRDQDAFVMSRQQAGYTQRKKREMVYVDLPTKARKCYDKTERDYVLGDEATKWRLALCTWLTRLAGGFYGPPEAWHLAKMKALLRLLTVEFAERAVIVWFRFTVELLACKRTLQQAGWRVATIRGRTKPETRAKRVRLFQAGKRDALLCQIACGRYGMTLSNAAAAIYFSTTASFNDRLQSEDRIVTGKGEPVRIIDLVARETVDEDLALALRRKRVSQLSFFDEAFNRTQRRVRKAG